MKWPCTTAFLKDDELDYYQWSYRVWQGSTYWVLEFKNNKWFIWYYTSGANPKFKKFAPSVEHDYHVKGA